MEPKVLKHTARADAARPARAPPRAPALATHGLNVRVARRPIALRREPTESTIKRHTRARGTRESRDQTLARPTPETREFLPLPIYPPYMYATLGVHTDRIGRGR